MRKVKPYINSNAALKAIDNGGRFYNLLTKADDGEISRVELAKAAGVFNNKPLMHLYLEMSLFELEDSTVIHNALTPILKEENEKYSPVRLTPAESQRTDLIGNTAVVTGIPVYTESNTKFSGFIMVPITANNVTTFIMVPLIEKYDVYELRDENSDNIFLLAHAKSKNKLQPVKTRMGGFLKELKKDKDDQNPDMFLEACYYTPLA